MLVEGCKHEVEVTVPVDEIDRETGHIVEKIQKKVRLPGFRPGKAPASLIRSKFSGQVRQDVLESLIPKYLEKRFREEDLRVVGAPNITEVHFDPGEPLRFKAQFEVAPEVELGEYRNVAVHYHEPEVTDEDISKRLEEMREQKAEYINIDPRPVQDGDYAVVSLESLSGVDEPVKQDELVLHVGDPDTMTAFTENLIGMEPEEQKEFEVAYPEDYWQERLAGKTVRFRMRLKGVRLKELPSLDDDFAKDLGDYQNLDELREAVRKAIFHHRENDAQRAAKDKIVDRLVEAHEFPVPEAFIDRQIETQLEQQLRGLAAQGVDVKKLKPDWAKLKESQRGKAVHDVKASLLLDKIADREGIDATTDEVDREVQRIARQEREPVAAARKRLEKEGLLRRIALHIRSEKTLAFLFEHATKDTGTEEAPEETSAPE
ncbi:MAG: trigger factor [Bryobacteraceae bacterium]